MRILSSFALLLTLAATLRADTFVYVSMAPEKKIQIFRLESNGALVPVDTVAVDAGPGSLCVDPAKKHLYSSLRTNSSLASFRIDSATGKLKQLGTAALVKDENAAFVGTDRSGRWLVSASYAAGKVVVHRVVDGVIQSPAAQVVTTAKTAHSAFFDKANTTMFVPHVVPNAVYQFQFDAETGKLTETAKAPGGTANAGPRHLALHPTMNLAFTSDEVGNSITAYRIDAKTGLAPLQTLTTLPENFKTKNTTAEVKVHPNGKFVWVSNRGHDSLAGYAIDDAGKLSSIGQAPTEKTPRSFDIDPDGRFLFAAGEGTGKLAVYSIAANGGLTRVHTYDVGKSLTWVMSVKY